MSARGSGLNTEQRRARLRSSQREIDVLKELPASGFQRYDRLRSRVAARCVQQWYRNRRRSMIESGRGALPATTKSTVNVYHARGSEASSPLKAVADDMSRLEPLQARVVSTAIMQGLRAGVTSQNLITASKQVAEMLGTAQEVDSCGIEMGIPSQHQLRQARLVGLRQKALQLLQKKYAREATNGDPLAVQQRRLDLTKQFLEKIESLMCPTQLVDILPSPTPVMSTAAASEFHAKLSMQMTSDDRLSWPNGASEAHKASALAGNAATLAAMQVDHNWWRVYAANTATTADVRATHQDWPWADDVDKNMVQNASQPGWRAMELRTSLMPNLQLPVDPVARPSDIHEFFGLPPDSMSLLSDSPLLRNKHDIEYKKRTPIIAQAKSRTERDSRVGTMSESDASDWWLSYACTDPPKLSANIQERAADDTRRAFTTILAVPQAMEAWSVIDPWSTATARIDVAAASARAKEAASADVGTATEFQQVEGGVSGPVRMTRLQDDIVDLELAITPALDFYQSGTASDGAGLQSLPIRRGAAGLVETAALAKPAGTVTARVHAAYDALRRNHKDLEAIVDLPGSLHTLTKDVAARKIQRTWRGVKVIATASRELHDRRQRTQAASLHKLAVVQQAMLDFCKVLESTAGVSLGVSEPVVKTSNRNGAPNPVTTAEISVSHGPSADKMIGTMLAEALSSINRSTVRVAHQVINGQSAMIPKPVPLQNTSSEVAVGSYTPYFTYPQAPATPGASTSSAAQQQVSRTAAEDSQPAITASSPSDTSIQPTGTAQPQPGVPAGVVSAQPRQSRSAAFRSKINIDEYLIPAALIPTSNGTPAPLVATSSSTVSGDKVRPALTSYATYGDVKPLIVSTPSTLGGTPTPLSTPALASSLLPDSNRSGTFGSTTLREGLVFAVDPVLLLPTESRYAKPTAATRK